ncbi:MAG: hypothetical protein HFH96_16045 [Lachnospiraceae bacterium]|nr:hypothetical protein [Lachnospiraceae bacterium]
MKNYREVANAVLERRDAYQKAKERRRNIAMRAAAGGGALCLMALLGLTIYGNGGMHPDGAGVPLSDSDVYYAVSDSGASNAHGSGGLAGSGSTTDGGGSLAAPGERVIDGSDAPNVPPASGQETASKEDSGMLPISYSSLPLPQGQVMPDILLEYAASSQSTADVLPFSEELLSESSAILEGRITDMYLKRYTYDTYNDKFGPREVYHNQSSSVVYELTVDKVWYGDESLTGTSVLIEDDIYLIDSYFSLKVGRSYVIPVCDLAPEKQIWEEYAGGDLTRDGRYTTLYPHHPQIEVTSDRDYIVTTDWETLCPEGASPIRLDIPENSFVEYHPENKAGEDGLITTEWRTLA